MDNKTKFHKVIDFQGYELILHIPEGITLAELKEIIGQFKEVHQSELNKKYLSVTLKDFFLEKGFEVEYIRFGPTIDLRKG